MAQSEKASLSLRERSKEARKTRILGAASSLIRETGSTDFSMQELAGRANVSLATTYNLIGVKAAVLYALLDQSLDLLGSRQSDISEIEPLASRVEAHCRLAARHFGSDADYHRPLMRYLLGSYEPERRPRFMDRALSFWRVAFRSDDKAPPPDSFEVSEAMHIAFTGALDIWVHHEVSSAELEARVLGIARLMMNSVAADI